MTQFLPPHLFSLFFPRPPISYLHPVSSLIVEREPIKYTGVAQYLSLFEDPKDTPPKVIVKTKAEIRAEKLKQKEELLAFKLEREIANYQLRDTNCLMKQRKQNYEEYLTRNEKPRGYAFIEYSRKSEMSCAYKEADGIRIDRKRVLVDYERGRTRKDWLPRRLGGGKGRTRALETSRRYT
ncbi:U1 small nuclear ribonucleoprotein 70 kDa [Strongyloides ratti]|uniref:U1 small nuclear ribonucleoprotein 70 kDa n=1 Tax=Strongyloides ratti TaxID=34506 RepID=A0A090LAL7_STRRB|nr:U1 small nuclear ribonucleoprotein 70 kDa [Strongyloides ratti]CEF66831.1 U1 small nuclear ribonucleoprotein 70 kDa [Strongyloides ratti]